jgi:predicted solute-binding protein
MKIQLDTGAMNSLFPEGSQARIDLQNAVVANFAIKMQDKFIKDDVYQVVKAALPNTSQSEIQNKVDEAVRSQFSNVIGYWNKAILLKGSKTSDCINEYAETRINELLESYGVDGKNAVEKHVKDAQAKIEVSIQRAIEFALRRMQTDVEQQVRASMTQIIAKELKLALSNPSSLMVK